LDSNIFLCPFSYPIYMANKNAYSIDSYKVKMDISWVGGLCHCNIVLWWTLRRQTSRTDL